MEDERRSPGTVTISALPSRRAEGREPWPADRAPHLRSPTFAGLRAPADEFPVAVRLSSDGGVLEDRGDAEELVGLAAYGVHLAEQIGGLLGLQRFVALEYPWHDAGRLVICAAPDGSTIAVCGRRDANFAGIRQQLGLSGRG